MLEVFRVQEAGGQNFVRWAENQPNVSVISGMRADDGSIVYLLKNSSSDILDTEKIPGFGSSVRRLNQAKYNFEFEDMDTLRQILEGDSDWTIGANYIRDLIEESVQAARPVTIRLSHPNETYVIVRQDSRLEPVLVQ